MLLLLSWKQHVSQMVLLVEAEPASTWSACALAGRWSTPGPCAASCRGACVPPGSALSHSCRLQRQLWSGTHGLCCLSCPGWWGSNEPLLMDVKITLSFHTVKLYFACAFQWDTSWSAVKIAQERAANFCHISCDKGNFFFFWLGKGTKIRSFFLVGR